MNKFALGLIGGGAIALSLSLVLGWLGLPHVLRSQIKKASRLTTTSQTFAIWKETPFPVYMKFHLFTVTNPEEVKAGEKPIVKEMGPYTYLEKMKKMNIRPGEANLTLIYHQVRTYYFRPELSQGTEEDLITHVNIPLVSVAKMTHEMTDLASSLDEKLTEAGETLFKTSTVRDLLFDGVSIQPFLEIFNDPAAKEAMGDVKIPKVFLDGKFALYDGKNGTDDGTFEVKTGTADYREYGQLVHWNNLTALQWWKDKSCNEINGTDGAIFRPFLTRASVLRAYNPDLCRTIQIVYDHDVVFKMIPLYRFTISGKMFQGQQNNAENKCFCTEKDESVCERDGALVMSGCADGAPIMLSAPHFLGGQQSLVSAIDGINPNESMHKTFMDIEPISGVAVRAAKRLQFNVDMTPYENMPSFAKIQKMLFPVMWAEESVELPDDFLLLFNQLYMVLEIVDVGKWVMVFGSTGILLLGCVCGALRKDKVELMKQ